MIMKLATIKELSAHYALTVPQMWTLVRHYNVKGQKGWRNGSLFFDIAEIERMMANRRPQTAFIKDNYYSQSLASAHAVDPSLTTRATYAKQHKICKDTLYKATRHIKPVMSVDNFDFYHPETLALAWERRPRRTDSEAVKLRRKGQTDSEIAHYLRSKGHKLAKIAKDMSIPIDIVIRLLA